MCLNVAAFVGSIFDAINDNNIKEVERLLNKQPKIINKTVPEGQSPPMNAV